VTTLLTARLDSPIQEIQMPGDRFPAVVAVAFLLPAALVFKPADAQTDASSDAEAAQVVITGTRVQNRSALETAVPVDVLSSDLFRNRGVPEISQALSAALPSYNYPRPGLSDGTDTVRPATLRGLSADETLVLVNGKRRQSAALVNVNATIGRGASSVDLNTIPDAMVKSVEVLRDGASAQYGSDAIAGVIDLRLREDRDGGDATVSYGVHRTSYDIRTGQVPAGAGWSVPATISRSLTDGGILTMSAWKGLSLGPNGFLTIAAEFKNQAHTERGGYDVRQQYPKVNGAFDPRELAFDRFNAWYGEPKINQKTVFANMGYDLAGGAKLYGWASYQDRNALSAGFYRPAVDNRNTISIYPDGFLPLIALQNGFRAPSLQQQYFATTSTNFIGGVPFDITTFPATDPVAVALGARPLTAEKSVNFSVGSVIRVEKLNITIDAYRIDITNRIVLSENLTQANVRAYLTSLGFTGVGGGRFFINGVDTRTQGVDIAVTYPFDLSVVGRVNLTLAGNLNSTDVRRVPHTAPLAALNPSPVLFDRVNVLTLEDGEPKNKFIATANWSLGPWGATLRATRYGTVLSPDTAATYATVAAHIPVNDVVLHAKTLVDLEGRFAFTSHLNLALGAENLFDQYPDSNPPAANATGTQSFSQYSPFGRSGRFVYGRLSYDF
jgi:outer membrane receptor protein involved in Fe transport